MLGKWNGFAVSGVSFVYARNVEQNYFHNAGAGRLDVQDGLRVRVHYLPERDGGTLRNHIVRFEVAAASSADRP